MESGTGKGRVIARTRVRRAWLVSAVLLVTIATVAAAATVAPSPARTSRTVVVGGDDRYPPFQFVDAEHQPQGFDIEVARAVLQPQGWSVRFELGDWDKALDKLDRGEVDVVPMFMSEDRDKRFLFSQPYMLRYHVVFGRRGSPVIESLEALAGHRVAVQRAGLAAEALAGSPSGAVQLVEVDFEADALESVDRGDAEYALVPTGIGLYATAQGGMDDIVALGPPLLERQYVFAVRRDRPELVPIINAGLDRVRTSGERDRLYEAAVYGAANPSRDALVTVPVIAAVGAALLLLIVVVAWRRTAATGPRPDQGARSRLIAWLGRRIRRQPQAGFALAEIHLLGLDLIGDVAGEAVADRVVRKIQSRLEVTPGVERVTTLGGGSLGLVLDGITDRTHAEAAMKRLAICLSERLDVGELPVELRSRIGTALYPGDATDPAGLVRAARMACEAARKQVAAGVYYHPGLEPDPRHLTLLAELREAIASGQLGYALQPTLDLGSRCWTGAELLVRWQHPRYGPLPPVDFVPLAEREGVIGEMTLYMVKRALEHCRAWREQGRLLTIAVNVSANDLADPALVSAIIDASGDLGPQLVLELTETDAMRHPEKVVEALARLRPSGIRISVDDFGTGHSSFTNLRLLDADELKIDRTFVMRLLQSPSDQAIVRATIRLAHDLGLSVTAEGIEDDATLAWLAEAGCNAAQGFALAKPMTPEAFASLLDRGTGPGQPVVLH